MTVTGIEKTRRGRYALMVDGEFAFSVHRDTFLMSRLSVGLELAPRELERLRREDEDYSAVQSALEILSRAAQSTGMLREKLLPLKFSNWNRERRYGKVSCSSRRRAAVLTVPSGSPFKRPDFRLLTNVAV